MAMFHVQRQCWQRWPRVLIVERKGDNGGHEERRYIPEGKTEGQWKELCRKMTGLRDKSARESEEKAQLLIEAQDELLSRQAEIDGLRWAVEERDQLIRDLLIAYFENTECRLGDCRDCGSRDWPHECEGWLLFDRAEQMGVEV